MKSFLIFILALFMASCGGVVGNIKMDTFDCYSASFQSCLSDMFDRKLLFKPDSLSIYKDDSNSKIAIVLFQNDTFAFAYEISRAVNRGNSPMLIVTNFGKNGDVLEFNKNLTAKQKETFDQIYYKVLLPNFSNCNCHRVR